MVSAALFSKHLIVGKPKPLPCGVVYCAYLSEMGIPYSTQLIEGILLDIKVSLPVVGEYSAHGKCPVISVCEV